MLFETTLTEDELRTAEKLFEVSKIRATTLAQAWDNSNLVGSFYNRFHQWDNIVIPEKEILDDVNTTFGWNITVQDHSNQFLSRAMKTEFAFDSQNIDRDAETVLRSILYEMGTRYPNAIISGIRIVRAVDPNTFLPKLGFITRIHKSTLGKE